MRISDWSSDVCSSDLPSLTPNHPTAMANQNKRKNILLIVVDQWRGDMLSYLGTPGLKTPNLDMLCREGVTFRNHFTQAVPCGPARASRSEEHTSELQSLMRTSYAVFCLKKKKQQH